MATLELKTIRCHRMHDIGGDDEVTLNVNSAFVWNGVMRKDEVRTVGVNRGFVGSTSITLEETSNGKAKQIGGAVTVRDSGSPASVQFKTSGTHYELFLEVS